MKLLTNGALLCYILSLVGHVSKAAIGSVYMVLPAFLTLRKVKLGDDEYV